MDTNIIATANAQIDAEGGCPGRRQFLTAATGLFLGKYPLCVVCYSSTAAEPVPVRSYFFDGNVQLQEVTTP